MPGQSTMFVPLISCDFARSVCEHKANGLVYSRCPANTNDLATPLVVVPLLTHYVSDLIYTRSIQVKFNVTQLHT